MATISIHDLRPTGADLFDSSESYLQELSDVELSGTNGGTSPIFWASAMFTGMIVTAIIYETRH
jgi:hypothetical protein